MTESEAYELYDEMLDTEGEVRAGGLSFSPSDILKELDQVAYDCGFNDFCDAEGIEFDD